MEVKQNTKELLVLLNEVADDFDDTGCDGMGTISCIVMREVFAVLGREIPEHWDGAVEEEG